MKTLLFTIAILLIAGIVEGYGDCARNALGEFSYENRFTQVHRHPGLYATKVKRPTAYDQCGNIVTFRERDTIYVRDHGSFWKGSYRGKSGVWAQTIIDFDGPGGRQFGTFVYVLIKDLSYIKDKKVAAKAKKKGTIKNKVENIEKPIQADYLSVLILFACTIILFNRRAKKQRKHQTNEPILPQKSVRPVLRSIPPRRPIPPVVEPDPSVSPVVNPEPLVTPVAKSKPVDKPKPSDYRKVVPPLMEGVGAYRFPWEYTGDKSIYPETTYSGYSPTSFTPKEETKPQANSWDHNAFFKSISEDMEKRRQIEKNERQIADYEADGNPTYQSNIEWLKIENDRLRY